MNLLMKNDWNNIKVFAAVAQCQSLTHAGLLLGLNASTVMRRVGQFERECNVRLFERRSTGYRLTINGEAILAKLSEVTAQLNAFESFLFSHQQAKAQVMNVLIEPSLFVGISKHLSMLADIDDSGTVLKPEVNIVLGSDLTSIDSGKNQLALAVTDKPPEHLIGRPLGRCELKLYGSRLYFDSKSIPENRNELAKHCLVTCENQSSLNDGGLLNQHIDNHSGTKVECTSTASQLLAIRDGHGLGWLPAHIGDEAQDLIALNSFAPLANGDIWLLYHAEHKNNQALGKLCQMIKSWGL